MPPKRPPPGLAMTPAPKRPRITQGGEAYVDPAAPPLPSPWKRVRSTLLVLFFVVQVKGDRRHRRFRRMIRAEVDCAFEKHVAPIYGILESFGTKITRLSHAVEQIKHSHPNHYADEYPRSEANQGHTAVVEVTNQEQTTAVDGLTTSEACEGASVQLRFLDCLKSLVFTERKITAQDGMAIKIAIFRDNQIITSGPLSSARIKISALHGDFFNVVPHNWSENDFDERVVSSGHGAVLGGNCELKLENGMVSLDDICFKKVSSKSNSGKFILAARVHRRDRAGLRVKEAVMNPVRVQVSRNEPNAKSERPKLEEDLSRLRGISRNGPFFKWLQENNIRTVGDLLKALNKDEDKLRNEYFKLNKNRKNWEKIVQHANKLDLDGNHKLKSYTSADQNVVLFFNCVHDLIGAKFHGCYRAKDNFDQDHQILVKRLRKDAYNKLDSIEFDHVLEGNCPMPFSTIENICVVASPGTSGTNPPYHPTTPQGAFPNIGAGAMIPEQSAPPEQHRPHGYQGDQSSDQMAADYPQGPRVAAAEPFMVTSLMAIFQGTYSGGNNFSVQTPTDDFHDNLPGIEILDIPQQIYYETGPPGYLLNQPEHLDPICPSLAGDQSSGQMASDYPRADISGAGYCITQSSNVPLVMAEGTPSTGNNLPGTIQNAVQHATDDGFPELSDLRFDSPQLANYAAFQVQGAAEVEGVFYVFDGAGGDA